MSDTTVQTEERTEPEPEPRPVGGRGTRRGWRGGGSPLFRNAYALMLNTGALVLGHQMGAAHPEELDAVLQG
ncbi:hypothetical protein ACWDFH_25065, partial [Streptomyces kronopolitis]